MNKLITLIILWSVILTGIIPAEESHEKIDYFRGEQKISAEEFQAGGKNGKTISYYETGEKKEENHWKNGQKEGDWTQWYKDGKKRRETQLKAGSVEGKDIRWYANGKLRSEESYRQGKKHGPWLCWYENGLKQYEGSYRDNLRHGQWTYWNRQGKKTGQGEFRDGTGKLDFQYDIGKRKKHEEHFQGKAHGTWSEWYPNGNKKFDLQYDMGKLNGTFTRWYENGQKMRETGYKEDILHGQDTYWYKTGEVNFQREYNEGKRHNKWATWFQDGKKKGEGQYTEGTGTWQEFYREGTKKSEITQVQGKTDGKQTEWYENGNKKSEQSWKDGKRHGKWVWWTPSGEVSMEQNWEENRLLKQHEPSRPEAPPKTETSKESKENESIRSESSTPKNQANQADTTLAQDMEQIVRLQTNLNMEISVIVGISYKGKRQVFSYGIKSFNDKVAPDPDTVYEIGSISKTFTATLLADMVVKGYMDLYDPVEKFLPVNAVLPTYNGEVITLYHLATHTSSLPSMADNLADHILDPGDPFATYTCYDMYEFFSRVTLENPIGSKEEYSNFGVGLLGHVLGMINGTDYEELLKERVLEILAMNNTTLFLTKTQEANLAIGHKQDGMETPNWNLSDCLQGAGAIKSSLRDMFTYMEANMGLTKTPLREAMELAHKPYVRTSWGDYNGLGWGIEKVDDRDMIWHNGGTEGYHTFIGFSPELRIGVIVLSNYRGTNMDAIGRQVFRLLKRSDT